MSTLWEKGYAVDETLAKFTVGDDPSLDRHLAYYDCLASIAHAHMLAATQLLTPLEVQALSKELAVLATKAEHGTFEISAEQEDCHTAIENHLTDVLGEVGKKIHAARSRNDQVLTALRLYSKAQLRQLILNCHALAAGLIEFAEENIDIPIVGRTHMQKAMPSSLGLWAMAFAESLADNVSILKNVYELIDQCPLGSAASYGVGWAIDRELSSALLGFAKVQNNVLYAANSRGKFEAAILHGLTQVMNDLSKLSSDLIFFSLPETGYLKIPEAFCSGSSLMPQKRNPCALELTRAKAATVSSYLMRINEVIRPLPSGYHRDFQETKAPLIKGFDTTNQCVVVMTHVLKHLEVNKTACERAFTTEVFATDKAMRLTAQGVAFRDAYREVGQNLSDVKMEDARENIKSKTHIGATGNLNIELTKDALTLSTIWLEAENLKWKNSVSQLLENES
jgi:argininosuccinate lyase